MRKFTRNIRRLGLSAAAAGLIAGAGMAQAAETIKDQKRVTKDPMEAHYIGFNMWVQAVKQAGTTNVDAVRLMYGQRFKSLGERAGAVPRKWKPLSVRIGRVAQAVAEEVEGQHHDHHRQDRQHQPRVERDHVHVLGFGQQHAPAGDWRAQPEA